MILSFINRNKRFLLIGFAFLVALSLLHLIFSGNKVRLNFSHTRKNSSVSVTFNNHHEEQDLNCCVDDCAGKYKIAVPPHCPTKYMSFRPYAQFNNNLRELVSMLIIAIKAQRTVIIPDVFGYDWTKMVNLSDVCVQIMSETEIRELVGRNRYPIKSYRWDDNYVEHTNFYGRPVQKFVTERESTKTGDALCLGETIRSWDEDMIFVPNPFFTRISKVDYMNVLKRITFTDETAHECSRFRESVFGGGPYVGIHLRGVDFACYSAVKRTFVESRRPFLNEALAQCDMKWEYTSKLIKSYGYDPETVPIFFAHDHQRPGLAAIYTKRANVFQWDPKLDSNVDARMMDICLLSYSSLFLGNPYSSFSFNSAIWRESHGLSNETNTMAGYREMGFIHHLFEYQYG